MTDTEDSVGPGQRDPLRTLHLLWNLSRPGTRGPSAGLSAAQVVTAAIELADENGLDAVTMRAVGKRLGKSAMTAYTYVPGRPELLVLMVDAVFAELPRAYPDAPTWRGALETSALDEWRLYQRHPWVLQVPGSDLLLGPNDLAAAEVAVRALDGVGLRPEDMIRIVRLARGFVRGSARALADATVVRSRGGLGGGWWSDQRALVDDLVAADRYPTIARLWHDGAFDPAGYPSFTSPYQVEEVLGSFEFGLARMLDGLELYVASLRPRKRSASRSSMKN